MHACRTNNHQGNYSISQINLGHFKSNISSYFLRYFIAVRYNKLYLELVSIAVGATLLCPPYKKNRILYFLEDYYTIINTFKAIAEKIHHVLPIFLSHDVYW